VHGVRRRNSLPPYSESFASRSAAIRRSRFARSLRFSPSRPIASAIVSMDASSTSPAWPACSGPRFRRLEAGVPLILSARCSARSPRAAVQSDVTSQSRPSAIAWTIAYGGAVRRPTSRAETYAFEIPTRCASSSCVRDLPNRRCRSRSPNDNSIPSQRTWIDRPCRPVYTLAHRHGTQGTRILSLACRARSKNPLANPGRSDPPAEGRPLTRGTSPASLLVYQTCVLPSVVGCHPADLGPCNEGVA